MFPRQTIVFKYVKLVKKSAQKSKQLCLFPHCFGNSYSWVQIKSSVTKFLIQVIHSIASLQGSHSGLGIKHSCFTPKPQVSKEIEATLFYLDV